MYLLSVCIPTRNRPKELEATINNLTKQIELNCFTGLVQILVSDNTDDESLRINQNVLNKKNIKYIRNVSNLGYAKNINNLILNADGKYIWLLSDDDFVLEDAVKSIVQNLQSGQEINYLTFPTGGAFEGKLFNNNLYFEGMEQDYFLNGEDFLARYWISVIFISSNVFHKEEMLKHATAYGLLSEFNDVYQNSLLCISFIDKKGHVKIINKTLLIDNYGNKYYSRFTAVDVPVLKYAKLWLQLKNTNISKRVLFIIGRLVGRNIIIYGLGLVISRIEYGNNYNYEKEFASIFKNKSYNLLIRFRALLIFIILKANKNIARVAVRLICLLIRSLNYERMKTEAAGFERELKINKMRSTY